MLICKTIGKSAPMKCVQCLLAAFWNVIQWIAKWNVFKISKRIIKTALVRYNILTFEEEILWGWNKFKYIKFQQNCPHGCPCDSYNCSEPTIEPTSAPTTENPGDKPIIDIDEVIDIKQNQNFGMIANYFNNFEFSMEIKLETLTSSWKSTFHGNW